MNLRDEWNIYRKKNKKTQAQARLELRWSASLFNQFLCGRRPLNYDRIFKSKITLISVLLVSIWSLIFRDGLA